MPDLARRSTGRLSFCPHSARRRAALGSVRALHSAVSAPKSILHRQVFPVQHPGILMPECPKLLSLDLAEVKATCHTLRSG